MARWMRAAGLLAALFVRVEVPAAPPEARIVLKLRRPSSSASLERLHDRIAARALRLFDTPAAGLDRYRLVRVPEESLEEALALYRQDPNVELAEPDAVVRADALPNDPFLASSGSWGQASADLWGLHRIAAPAAWDRATGEGVVVAVLDTGIDYNHPDLRKNVWVNDLVVPDRNGDGRVDVDDLDLDGDGRITPEEIPEGSLGRDFVSGDDGADDRDPMDESGHGTHVAGTIAATANNATGIAGVAWGSRVMALRFLDESGNGAVSDAARAVVWAVDHGASVLNGSWGGSVTSTVLKEAFDYARRAGAVVVVSAGNSNADVGGESDCRFFPACLDGAITVAASDPDDAKAAFSNWGMAIDVTAPGGNRPADPGVPYAPSRNMLSLRAGDSGDPGLVVADSYLRLSGTSMAAPHVSGVAALVRTVAPGAGVELVRVILNTSAADVDPPGFDVHAGFGRVDAAEAVRLAGRAGSTAELAVTGFRLDVSRPGPRLPVPFSLRIENVGSAAAYGIDVVVREEGAAPEAEALARFRLEALAAGAARELSAVLWLAGVGVHRVVAQVDPSGAVAELSEANNAQEVALTVVPRPVAERRLTSDELDQHSPRIAGHWIAWQDERHAAAGGGQLHGSDIYLFDLRTGEERRVTTDAQDQYDPALSERWLAWSDDQSGIPEIRAARPDGGDAIVVTPGGQAPGAASAGGDRIAWRETAASADGDIFVRDLSSGEEVQVSGPWADSDPSIEGDRIAWVAAHDDRYHWIHLLDLADGSEHVIPRNPAGAGFFAPSVSEGRIVWHDVIRFHSDVWMYDLGPDSRFGTSDCDGAGRCERKLQLTTAPSNQWNASISGERIAWREHREDSYGGDIVVYDLGPDGIAGTGDSDAEGRSEGETWVTRDSYQQSAPQVFQTHVVWQDRRNGNWDIYAASIDRLPAAPARLAAAHGRQGIVLDWPDPDGESSYFVYRRDATNGAWRRLARCDASGFEDATTAPGAPYEYAVSRADQLGFEGPVSPVARAVANRPPAVAGLAETGVRTGDRLLLYFEVTDPDHDAVFVAAEGLPGGATVAPARSTLQRPGRATHVLRWTPAESQVGFHAVTLVARDGEAGRSLATRHTVRIRVLPARWGTAVE